MYPELFEIPLIHLTVKSHGLMIIIGFLAALALIKRLSRSFTPDPQLITNGGLYALLPWGVRFPYDSFAYNSQINPDPKRNRPEPYLNLPPDEYADYVAADGKWYPKAFDELTDAQKYEVTKGKYRCLPVHPTQLYSSVNGVVLCLLLYLFYRRAQKLRKSATSGALLASPGQTFALMFILYGVTRFFIEYLRDDNPFEYGPWATRIVYVIYKGGTISQNLSIYLVILGAALMAIFQKVKADKIAGAAPEQPPPHM